jgi:hypothetical protein
MEALAQRLGYPLGVGGYAPTETGYWCDPSLGWANVLLNPERFGLDPLACAQELAGLKTFPPVWNLNMAPRFPDGTSVAGRLLVFGDRLRVGEVLLWWQPGDAHDCPTLARVAALEPGLIRLSEDNGGRAHALPWGPGAATADVYRVTHYVRLPYLSSGYAASRQEAAGL